MKKCLVLLVFAAGCIRLGAQSIFDSLYTVCTAEFYFSSGSVELEPETQHLLDSLAYAYNRCPESAVFRIAAHTDSKGSAGENLILAENRGRLLIEHLKNQGIPSTILHLVALGEALPAAPNAHESGRRQNRRVVVELLKPVPMATFSGKVKDEDNGAGISAVVYFSSKSRQDSMLTDSEGNYSVRLPQDTIVKIEAIAKGYFFAETVLRVFSKVELYKRFSVSTALVMRRALSGKRAIIRDLFFVEGEAMLIQGSEMELPKVLRFLKINPELSIEIAGHINNPGRLPGDIPDWQWALSTNRAKVVYEYLLNAGICPSRLSYKGYGNLEMIFPNCRATEKQQNQNRRVEIRIL